MWCHVMGGMCGMCVTCGICDMCHMCGARGSRIPFGSGLGRRAAGERSDDGAEPEGDGPAIHPMLAGRPEAFSLSPEVVDSKCVRVVNAKPTEAQPPILNLQPATEGEQR